MIQQGRRVTTDGIDCITEIPEDSVLPSDKNVL